MSAVERRVEIVVGTASAEQRIAALGKQFASLKGASDKAGDAIDGLAQSATNLGTSIDKNGRLRDANGRFVKMGQDAKQASQGVDKLAQSTRKLGDNADYTSKLLGGLKGMMAGYFSLAGLGNVLKTADAMQNQNAQIKQVTESTEQYIAVKKQLFQIAQSTHQDIEATTTAYTNNARSLQQLGKNQAEILKFTESVSLAMAVGGKSAQEQASALVQLGQAMQSGVLQGDEFRSIAENAPILLDLVAKSLDKTRAEVKKLASDGKISAEVIYNAMAGASEELKAKYAAMPVTMNQALTTVQNQYKRLVDEFMNGTGGLSEKIASAILWVNEHFNSLVPTMAGLTAIYGGYLVMNSAFVASIPAKVAGLTASATAFYNESLAMNANAAAKARAVMANVTLTNAASAMAIGVSRAGIAVMNAAGFIDRKTASVVNASRSLVAYSANLVRTNGVLGATRLAVVGTTTALVAQARAIATSNAAKVALTATTRTMAGVMTTAGRAILSVGSIIKAHPIMILAGIITVVITATMGLEEAMESFGDAVTVVGMMIQDFVKWAVDGFTNKMGQAIEWVTGFFGNKSKQCTGDASKAFSNFFGTTEGGFLGMLQVVGRGLDALVGAVRASLHYTGIQVDNLLIRAQNAKNRLLPDFMGGGGEMQAENNASFGQIFAMYQHGLGIGAWIDSKISLHKANKRSTATDNVAALGSVAGVAAKNLSKLGDETEKAKKGQKEKVNKKEDKLDGARLVGISGNTGVGTGAHLDIRISGGSRRLTAQELSRFQAGGKELSAWRKTSDYGPRKAPTKGASSYHRGIDYAMPVGTAITTTHAVKDVKTFFDNKGGGWVSRVIFDDGLSVDLLHQSASVQNVQKGASAKKGDKAGEMVAKVDNDYQKDVESKLKSQADLNAKYGSWLDRMIAQKEEEIKVINDAFGEGSEQSKQLIDIVNQRHDLSVELNEKEQQLEMRGWQMSAEERRQLEHQIHIAKIRLNQDYTKEQRDKAIEIAQEQFRLDEERHASIQRASKLQTELDLYGYKKTAEERLAIEQEIKLAQIDASEEYTAQQKELYKQVAKERYEHDYQLFKWNEARKRQELQESIETHGLDYIRKNKLNSMTGLSKNRQELTYQQSDQKKSLEKNFNNVLDGIRQDEFLNPEEKNLKIQEATKQHFLALEAMKSVHLTEMRNLDMAYASETMQSFGSLADTLAGVYKNAYGEQSKSYKMMMKASKAFALADVSIKMGQAMAQAWADPSAVTIWQKIANASMVALKGGHLVSLIKATQMDGFKTGGYTGNGGVNDVAGVVHGKEYVLNARATKRIGTGTLDKLNNGGDIGGGVNVIINNYSSEKASVEKQPNGDLMVTIGMMREIARAESQKTLRDERKQGGLLYGA